MTFDELLAVMDGANVCVYGYEGDLDVPTTVYDGWDDHFDYEELDRDIRDAEVYSVRSNGDTIDVCVDLEG